MKAIDVSLRLATVAMFVAFFVLPNENAILGACLLFFALGLWSALYPPGILNWARTAHRELNAFDERLWPICRFIGISFTAGSATVAAILTAQRHR